MGDPTRLIGSGVRIVMARLARFLNTASKGKILPAHITVLSFLGHVPAAWALYAGRPALAALLIVVFGLMDALDGALAREQKSVSIMGMFFDAVTDRMKEILLYTALAAYAVRYIPSIDPWVIVAVAGTSILVSYVKAKGEMAINGEGGDPQKVNRVFDGGLARYEIRMGLLVIGLLSGEVVLAPILGFIIAINLMTAALRFLQISELLRTEQRTSSATAKKTTTHPSRAANQVRKK